MKNRELYTYVFEYNGNACIAISPPIHHNDDKVAVYDLDAGEIFSLDIEDILDAPPLRESEEEDFQFSTILESPYADEAWEISCELFD
jgi:hypothetical protein